jgi:type IV fimbrial biogenesis protein FimT
MRPVGATLLELMVVLAVSAILLTLGIPSLAPLIHASHLTSATNVLLSSLHLSRSEAIKRSARVVMCPSATGTSCAGNGGWHQGWVVFHDANNNAWLDAGEMVILTKQPLPAGLWATSRGSTARYISYAPSGDTKQLTGAWQAGTLTLCNESLEARQIIISRTGRPRTTKIALTSCP